MNKLLLKEKVCDLPREKAIRFGVRNLTDYELMAILLSTGSKEDDVISLARKLASYYSPISSLSDTTIEELSNFKGIGKVKALTILSAIELGKRSLSEYKSNIFIKCTLDIYNYLKPKLFNLKQETLLAVFLNEKGMVLKDKIISIGSINVTILDPRVIITEAVRLSSYSIIVSHNHPSGDSTPSTEDTLSTNNLIKSCNAIGIKLIDHLIIGNGEYFSFAKGSKVYIED